MKVKKKDDARARFSLPWLLGQPQPWWLTCVFWQESTRLEAPARASGPSEAFRKSPALSAAKEQRQKYFGARPQTIINADLCKLPC